MEAANFEQISVAAGGVITVEPVTDARKLWPIGLADVEHGHWLETPHVPIIYVDIGALSKV